MSASLSADGGRGSGCRHCVSLVAGCEGRARKSSLLDRRFRKSGPPAASVHRRGGGPEISSRVCAGQPRSQLRRRLGNSAGRFDSGRSVRAGVVRRLEFPHISQIYARCRAPPSPAHARHHHASYAASGVLGGSGGQGPSASGWGIRRALTGTRPDRPQRPDLAGSPPVPGSKSEICLPHSRRPRMDNLTHTLTGLALSQAGLSRWYTRPALLLMLAANIPDIDIVNIAGGPFNYFLAHRGITHAITMAPVMALL